MSNGKKVIISESMFKRLVVESMLNEADMSKADVEKIVKDLLKNDRQVKNDMDKRVRELVAASVNKLFMTLWQRRNFYENEIKKG